MKKFLFIAYQSGGCDYTIGCGVRVEEIVEAATADEALAKYVAECEDEHREDGVLYCNPWGLDHCPDSIEMYEVTTKHEVEFPAIKQRAQDELDGVRQKEQDDAERAEFERLKEKFS